VSQDDRLALVFLDLVDGVSSRPLACGWWQGVLSDSNLLLHDLLALPIARKKWPAKRASTTPRTVPSMSQFSLVIAPSLPV
jgi:hypothetical protein